MENVIKMTRELGKLLQESELYKAYQVAREKNDGDQQLQDQIGEFNIKRMSIHAEMQKPDKDQAKMDSLNDEVKLLYKEIMENKNMQAYNEAKESFDALLSQINTIVTYSANGEDPETCPSEKPSCSGSCSSCGGDCH